MKKISFILLVSICILLLPQQSQASKKETKDGTFFYEVINKKEVKITGCLCPGNLVIPAKIGNLPVTTIGAEAFAYREKHPEVQDYDDYALRQERLYSSVTFPSTVKEIQDYAFENQYLTAVTLPKSLKVMGDYVFAGNTRLKSQTLTIPNSVTSLGTAIGPFKKVVFPKKYARQIAKSSSDLYYEVFKRNGKSEIRITNYKRETKKNVLTVPAKINGIPVTEIGYAAFSDKSAFNTAGDTSKLQRVVLPNSIRKIDDYAFYSKNLAKSAKTLQLPTALQTIGVSAFEGYQITGTLILPEKLTAIGKRAFSNNKIEEVKINANLTVIREDTFSSNKINVLSLPSNLKTIEKKAFKNNSLTRLVLKNTVTKVATQAFESNKLEQVTIKANNVKVEMLAFEDNPLKSLAIMGKNSQIGLPGHSIMYEQFTFTNEALTEQYTSWGKVNEHPINLYFLN